MGKIIDFPRGAGGELSDEAIHACLLAGRHLLNSLAAIGVNPSEIETQNEALDVVWPTKWGYDAWCAWHACRIILRRSGRDIEEISIDRRTEWRTSASYVQGKAIIGPG